MPAVKKDGGEACGAHLPNKPEGVTCKNPAGFRTDHLGVGACYRHGGRTAVHNRAAVVKLAERECLALGLEIQIDPGETLIRAVWEAEGNLAFYRAKVNELSDIITTEFGPGGAMKETQHPIVELYHNAEKWRAQVGVAALKAGVEERRLRLAQSDSRALFGGVVKAIEAAQLTNEQAEVFRRALADFLRSNDEQPASLAG